LGNVIGDSLQPAAMARERKQDSESVNYKAEHMHTAERLNGKCSYEECL